jgi:hypothetical protein
MKRTVSLLAAAVVLIAGTAWGKLRTYGEITGHSVDEYGRVSVSYSFLYYKSSSSDANTARNFTFTLQYGIDGGTTYSTNLYTRTGWVPKYNDSSAWVEGHGTSDPIPGFELGDRVKFTLVFTCSYASLSQTDGPHYVQTSAFKEVTPGWDNISKEFVISGSFFPGTGIDKVRVTYELNASSLGAASPVTTNSVGADGAFDVRIPFGNYSDTLAWSLEALDPDGDALYEDADGNTVFTIVRKEHAYVEYTWTGLGSDNGWANYTNWSPSVTSCYGYPGVASGYPVSPSYHTSSMRVTNSATINLGGGSFRIWDGDGENVPLRGMVFDNAGDGEMVVTISNGTLRCVYEEDPQMVGAAGTTLVFDKALLSISWDDAGTQPTHLYFAPGATIVFSGGVNQNWYYNPTPKGALATTFIVRDGQMSSRCANNTGLPSGHTAIISNAVWTITGASHTVPSTVAETCVFRDGPDRQARLVLSSAIGLLGTYDIAIPKDGHAAPTITAASLLTASGNSCVFKIDVTDFAEKGSFPLVRLTSANTATDNGTIVSDRLQAGTLALQAYADGENVTKWRNARLEWDAATQTIYYTQDHYRNGTFLFLQ